MSNIQDSLLATPIVASDNDDMAHWALEYCDFLAASARLDLVRCFHNQYDWLDRELPNLRASFAWLATQDSKETAYLLLDYIVVIAPYLQQRGLAAELVHWCESGFLANDYVRQNPGQLLLLCGETQKALGQWDEAMASIQGAMDLCEGVDPEMYARSVMALGVLQFNQGDYVRAIETLERAEQLLPAPADYRHLNTIHSEIAAYYLNRGELDKALDLYLEIDQRHKKAGASESSDHTLLMVGVVYRKKKDFERASAYLQQLLVWSESQQNRNAMATAAHHLAWVAIDQQDLLTARRLCGKALMLYEEIGDQRGTADAYEQLGYIALAEGNAKESLPHLQRSLSIRRQLGNQHGAASSLRRLALTYIGLRYWLPAGRYLWQSLTLYQRLGMLSVWRLSLMGHEILDMLIRIDKHAKK